MTLIGVTGATGNVGLPLVQQLLARGVRVRALVRQPERAAAQLPTHPHLDIRALDWGKRPGYVRAFEGLEKLFVLRPPEVGNVQRDMIPALDVALGAGVRHFALLSLQGAEKLKFVPHAKLERHLQDSGAAYTFLRAGFFFQNLTTTHLPELQQGDLFVPAGQGRTSFVDVRDVAEAAAVVLTGEGHANTAYELTGSAALTYGELAAALSQAAGRPIRYTDPNPITFFRRLHARGVPTAQLMVMQAIYATARFGMAAHVSPDLGRLLRRAPTTAAQFAQDAAPLLTRTPQGASNA